MKTNKYQTFSGNANVEKNSSDQRRRDKRKEGKHSLFNDTLPRNNL